jgi:hypothetical protein
MTPQEYAKSVTKNETYQAELIKAFEAGESNWISVDERLPENENNVLAVLDNEVCIMNYFEFKENGETFKVWGYCYDGVNGDGVYDDNYYPTHWMPLPKSPKKITPQEGERK